MSQMLRGKYKSYLEPRASNDVPRSTSCYKRKKDTADSQSTNKRRPILHENHVPQNLDNSEMSEIDFSTKDCTSKAFHNTAQINYNDNDTEVCTCSLHYIL